MATFSEMMKAARSRHQDGDPKREGKRFREILSILRKHDLKDGVSPEAAVELPPRDGPGTSMLFHYGRTFEINDLAAAPAFQRRGIAKRLFEQCLSDLKEQGIVGVHLITAGEGVLPAFYEKHGLMLRCPILW